MKGRMCYIVSMIWITDQLLIPEDELRFSASRSSGPGGQHVNKASTRVTLKFDVTNSPSLTTEQKHLIFDHLTTRISKKGVLRVVCQKTRSQAANKAIALERFTDLLQQALKPTVQRKPTKTSPAAKQKRIDEKKKRSQVKRERAWKPSSDD